MMGQIDGYAKAQRHDHYIDPAPQTMQAVSINTVLAACREYV